MRKKSRTQNNVFYGTSNRGKVIQGILIRTLLNVGLMNVFLANKEKKRKRVDREAGGLYF